MKKNVIQDKSYKFALRTIKAYQHLKSKQEYDLGRQLLRSGTSIGANIEEAIGGQTEKDFFAKMNIAHKESRETNYWLRLLKDSEILEEKIASSLIMESEELIKLSAKIITTMKNKLKIN
ncbi:MAG: four helix bundle protein [Saprospiraceae bacterium]|nr:four helix bundle protein [Saprospiraceae bacterium]